MILSFKYYLETLYTDVPQYVYYALISILLFSVLLSVYKKGIRRCWRLTGRVALAEYILLTYFSTIFFRTPNPKIGHNFMPFWSYSDILKDPQSLGFPQVVMNVMVFIPLGLLLGMSFKSIRWWHALCAGAGISISIEVIQFFTKRGFSEFDDVMHNTLGCMIGYGVYRLVALIAHK